MDSRLHGLNLLVVTCLSSLAWGQAFATTKDQTALAKTSQDISKSFGANELATVEYAQLAPDSDQKGAIRRLGSAEDPNRDDVNKIAFIMPPDWLLIPTMAVRDGDLMFRRYGFKIANQAGRTEFSPDTFKLAILGPIGTIINSQFVVCRRSARESDHITLHLPADVGLRSFDAKSWQSKIEIRSLAGNSSRRTMGEYIRGDFFLDATSMPVEDYVRLLTASRVTYEFGDKNDRLQFIIESKWGDATIGDFLRDAIPQILKVDPKTVGYFNTEAMLKACLAYKRTGKIPLPSASLQNSRDGSSAKTDSPTTFSSFPASRYDGQRARIILSKETRPYRTRLTDASLAAPNFAGRYVLTTWGCGTSCLMGAVIDISTGHTTMLPFSICCSNPVNESFKAVNFRPDSRLVVFSGMRNEEEPMGAHYYEIDGRYFKFIETVIDDGKFAKQAN